MQHSISVSIQHLALIMALLLRLRLQTLFPDFPLQILPLTILEFLHAHSRLIVDC